MHPPHASSPTPTASTGRTRLGQLGEDLAVAALRAAGFDVLARNWRLTTGAVRGELDLVCRDGDRLVVVEVKTRRSRRLGGPLYAVTPDKQARIRALAASFLQRERVGAAGVRFDVVGVIVDPATPGDAEIEHVRGAF